MKILSFSYTLSPFHYLPSTFYTHLIFHISLWRCELSYMLCPLTYLYPTHTCYLTLLTSFYILYPSFCLPCICYLLLHFISFLQTIAPLNTATSFTFYLALPIFTCLPLTCYFPFTVILIYYLILLSLFYRQYGHASFSMRH